MKGLTVFFIMMLPVCLFGQDYDRAAGLRLGHTSGVNYKRFVNEKEAYELILSGRREGMQITGLYEFHNPMQVGFDKNFHFYYGIGAHIGFERYDDLQKVLVSEAPLEFVYEDRTYFAMGVDVLAGVEYRYLTVPMTIAFELKPYYNFVGMRYSKATFWDAALSVKYVF